MLCWILRELVEAAWPGVNLWALMPAHTQSPVAHSGAVGTWTPPDAPAAPLWRAAWKLWSQLLAMQHRTSRTQDVVDRGGPWLSWKCTTPTQSALARVLPPRGPYCFSHHLTKSLKMALLLFKLFHTEDFGMNLLGWDPFQMLLAAASRLSVSEGLQSLSLPLLSKSVNLVFTTLEISQLLLFNYLKKITRFLMCFKRFLPKWSRDGIHSWAVFAQQHSCISLVPCLSGLPLSGLPVLSIFLLPLETRPCTSGPGSPTFLSPISVSPTSATQEGPHHLAARALSHREAEVCKAQKQS